MNETPVGPEAVVVTAPMRRSYSPGMFADLVRADVRVSTRVITTTVAWDGCKVWELTFIGTDPGPALSATEAAAVWARLESTDDVDQARRVVLRADRDATAAGTPERRMYDYLLGD